jgi:hypothetical protein
VREDFGLVVFLGGSGERAIWRSHIGAAPLTTREEEQALALQLQLPTNHTLSLDLLRRHHPPEQQL